MGSYHLWRDCSESGEYLVSISLSGHVPGFHHACSLTCNLLRAGGYLAVMPFFFSLILTYQHHLARNLKFYPLALRNAVKDFGPLSFIADTFLVETCNGPKKLFKNLSKWELLNLKVPTVLEIPDRLSVEYGISSTFLQNTMKKYGIQSVGLGSLERQYDIDKPIQYMLASTRHYSWPKGGGE